VDAADEEDQPVDRFSFGCLRGPEAVSARQ
jgi:hypothetical protein